MVHHEDEHEREEVAEPHDASRVRNHFVTSGEADNSENRAGEPHDGDTAEGAPSGTSQEPSTTQQLGSQKSSTSDDPGLTQLVATSSRGVILAVLNVIAFALLVYTWVLDRAAKTSLEAQHVSQAAEEQDESGRAMMYDLYASSSPTAYQEIAGLLVQTTDPSKRQELVKVLAFRARRLGLGQTSDIVLGQLGTLTTGETLGADEISQPLVRLLDPSLSSSARLEELARLYNLSPRLATTLAGASALDTGEAEPYRGIFAKAAAEDAGAGSEGERNPYALMLLNPDLHDLFSEDIVALEGRISGVDLVWLLEQLGRQGRSEVSTVAQIAVRRGIEKGARVVFLQEVARSASLPQRIRSSIVSGALGKVTMDDVRRFGEWYGQGAPRVLEATILTTSEPSLRQAAFDALLAKPLGDPYIARVMDFIRTTYGSDSGGFAGLVGALALRDDVGEDILRRELEVVRNAPRSRELLRQLVRGAPVQALPVIVEMYSDSMDQLDIVDLLTHSSPRVRTVAVSRLSKVNDIMLLKLILQSYDDERDPDVRAVYEEKISIVKERLP